MKTIVATTDFTPVSQNAVHYAAELASVLGMKLSVLHVCGIPMSFSEIPAPACDLVKARADAENDLARIKENLEESSGGRLPVKTQVRIGEVIDEINEHCNTIKPFAVVMGAETTNAFERYLFGGKTIAALKQVAWPLIVVPPNIKFSAIRNIALACDCKDVVETLPGFYIRTLVKDLHAQLHVLHIAQHDHNFNSREAEEEFDWLKEILRGVHPKYHIINGEEVEKSVTEFTENNDIDLLIVIPKKYNFLRDLFRHHHSKNLALQTHVPIMAIH
ncbi:universal stress protein [Chitinophagaceae bacterium 26-R-25]|nr:universal stress protein [Chitinophagaceae bacterium 26-R-25]